MKVLKFLAIQPCYIIQGLSSTEFDYYMAYKEENIIEILNTLELDGYIRIPRNPKKVEQIKKALEEEHNLDFSDHLGWFHNEYLSHHLFNFDFDPGADLEVDLEYDQAEYQEFSISSLNCHF